MAFPVPSIQAPSTRAVYTFRDAEGKTSTVVLHFVAPATQAEADGMGAALEADSTLSLVKYTLSTEYGWQETLPTVAEYPNAEDKAFVVFANTFTGHSISFEIPGPKVSDFETDSETVLEATGTAMATALNTNTVSDVDGLGTTTWAYLRGYLKRAKTRRKFSPGWASETGGD